MGEAGGGLVRTAVSLGADSPPLEKTAVGCSYSQTKAGDQNTLLTGGGKVDVQIKKRKGGGG